MKFIRTLLINHPLVNILFSVVLIMGFLSFIQMPIEQDPEINFNLVSVNTVLPGASAADVEQLVTGPLEDALRNVQDIKFVASNSRESVSNIFIRFREISERKFDKRVTDIRREIQSKANDELPDDIEDPYVQELTTSNGFPTAMVLVVGQADDEKLRRQGKLIKEGLLRIVGVDRVQAYGFNEPELQVEIDPHALASHGLTAADVANQLRESFRNVSAGKIDVANEAWLVRVRGKTAEPEDLANFIVSPISAPQNKVSLDQIANVQRGHKEARQAISFEGRPAISMSITKASFTNTIDLVDRINTYIEDKNILLEGTGIELILSDDQTQRTRHALTVMERNAAFGLFLVLGICWLFLGIRIASFVTIGIAFSIAGTFWVLNILGNTLNIAVLLGIVIVLGMLVDDAVVVVEAIYYRLQRGQQALAAAIDSLREVAQPVTSAVLTTICAFTPLMLLPGILGDFMFVIPLVVTVGLLVSLVEAFWILPSHVVNSTKKTLSPENHLKNWRSRWIHKIRIKYTRSLAYVVRHPTRFLIASSIALALSIGLVVTEKVRIEFFTFDPIRLLYVNVNMPTDSPIQSTLEQTERVERIIRPLIQDDELRSITVISGVKFVREEALVGDQYGQIQVSLRPKKSNGRSVSEIVDSMKEVALDAAGDSEITYLEISKGPPVARDISVKVRSHDPEELRAATDAVKKIVQQINGAENVEDNDVDGRLELTLNLDERAVRQAGTSPGLVARLLRLHMDGEIVAFTRDEGEKVELRVRGPRRVVQDINTILDDPIVLPNGSTTTFRALTNTSVSRSSGTIRRYNYRRSITVEADLDAQLINTVIANNIIQNEWLKIRPQFPMTDLDFSGAFQDVQESLDYMIMMFFFGVGLIYLVLATQFKSYFQPMLIIVTVPMAFTGVIFGLFITKQMLTLYTIYGVVALTGIAVNAAIVLIDAANRRIKDGMRPLHAIMYAARRRVIPILMTTFTTIGGLFALATGLGGKSLLWGPVATSMVFGLFVATILTLFVLPVLFRSFMRLRNHRIRNTLLRRKQFIHTTSQ
jgi:multidrug efflux pump subunit AcrB